MNKKLEAVKTGQDKQQYQKNQNSLLKHTEANPPLFPNLNQDPPNDRLHLGQKDKSKKKKTPLLTIDLSKLLKKTSARQITRIVCSFFENKFKDWN